MGIQFPPIAFLCQLYLYIYICCCCCALVKSIIKPQTLNHLFEVHAYMHVCTLGSRGYFFLIDTDGSWRSRVNEALSAKRKNNVSGALSNRKPGLFHILYFEKGPLERG